MDHLPPVTVRSTPIRVPYYGGVYDDHPDWFNFPTRHGWDTDALADGDLKNHTVAELTALLQTWFYFGILCSLSGRSFTTIASQFITKTDGSADGFITTKHLKDLLKILVPAGNEEQGITKRTPSDFGVRIFLHLANSYDIPIELALSLDFLFEALDSLQITKTARSSKSLKFLESQNVLLGDCISTVLRNEPTLSGQYLRYLLGPANSTHDHTHCTYNGCKAYNTMEDTYCTTPARSCSRSGCCRKTGTGCQMIGIEQQTCLAFLRSGSLPVVCINLQNGNPRLEVIAYEEGIQYVAISHMYVIDSMIARGNTEPS